jgi:hypothetical protein
MTPQDESSVRAYLLGAMASGDRNFIEERMIAEPDLAEQVEAMEGELIRDALRGELSDEDQVRFDQYFLGNESTLRKYSLTRELLIAGGQDAAVLRALPVR